MPLHKIFKNKAGPIYTLGENASSPEEEWSSEEWSEDESGESLELSDELTPLSDAQFWNIIGKLRWSDLSDGKMNISLVKERLASVASAVQIEQCRSKMAEIMANLKELMVSVGYEENIDNEFLSHVIGKGRVFYYNVLDDPEFSTYLLAGETQNLWMVFA